MAKKLLLINLLMMAGVLFLAERLVASWSEFRAAEASRRTEHGNAPAPTELELPAVTGPEPVDGMDSFLIVSDKNLFSDDRGTVAESGDGGPESEPPPLAVKPKLLSVSLFNGNWQAVLSVFEGNRGSKAESRVVNIGDDVQGYQVSRIESTELGLSWNGNEIHTIPLDTGGQEARPQVARSQQAVRIITVGSAVAAVETVNVSDAPEDQRGIEVGVVSAGTAAGQGGRARQGVQDTRGAGGRNFGGRNQLGGRSQLGLQGRGAASGSNRNQGAPVGLGSVPSPSNPPQN